MKNKVTCYTTKTGLQIGRFYERKLEQPMSFDMELLQSAYLNDPAPLRGERIRSIGYVAGVIGFLICLLLITKN
mgnify:CR=1 FL=1